jgi:hypothetical protein
MLKNIEEKIETDDEPLYVDSEESEEINLEILHGRLGLIQRVILFIKALISQRNVLDVLEESLLQRYGAEIERSYEGLFNAKANSLGFAFAKELKGLRDALAPFVDPLTRALGPEKREFVVFMAGLEFPLHQDRILEITNPESYMGEGVTELDLRRQMDTALQEALKDISESDRSEVYGHVRALHFLKELVSYQFSKILSSFVVGAEGQSVPVDQVRAPLLEFGDILVSQGDPPGITALKALRLFDPKLGDGQDLKKTEEAVSTFIEDAVQGLAKVRSFCAAIPVKKLLKVASANVSYSPDRVGGGEDWFALYRKFWEDRIDNEMEVFSFRNRRQRLQIDASRFLRVEALPTLEHYTSQPLKDGGGVKYGMTLSFLYHFVERIFMTEMHRALKIFMVDGDFYKSHNRQEFTESYDGVRGVLGLVKRLDADLSSSGESGHELMLVRGEIANESLRRDRLRSILKKVDDSAEEITDKGRGNLAILISVVKGILFGESGGRYDTLSNISYIGGSENASLLERLRRSLKQAEEAQRILNELYDLERDTD